MTLKTRQTLVLVAVSVLGTVMLVRAVAGVVALLGPG